MNIGDSWIRCGTAGALCAAALWIPACAHERTEETDEPAVEEPPSVVPVHEKFRPGEEMVIHLKNTFILPMVWIPSTRSAAWQQISGGRAYFMMGSPPDEPGRGHDENPHPVIIGRGFWMSRYEITQEQYRQVAGKNPSRFRESDGPVEDVSWNDAKNFCNRLTELADNMKFTRSGRPRNVAMTFRLPTEAEWEYACRAGTVTPYACGETLSCTQAVFHAEDCPEGRPIERPISVGTYTPNAWGLYDMHGNVSEWCEDWYGAYPPYAVTDPIGPPRGAVCVNRGGSWYNSAGKCRSAERFGFRPMEKNYDLGFRIVAFERR